MEGLYYLTNNVVTNLDAASESIEHIPNGANEKICENIGRCLMCLSVQFSVIGVSSVVV